MIVIWCNRKVHSTSCTASTFQRAQPAPVHSMIFIYSKHGKFQASTSRMAGGVRTSEAEAASLPRAARAKDSMSTLKGCAPTISLANCTLLSTCQPQHAFQPSPACMCCQATLISTATLGLCTELATHLGGQDPPYVNFDTAVNSKACWPAEAIGSHCTASQWQSSRNQVAR